MCSEFFRIPMQLGGLPLFGFGLLFAVWVVGSVVGWMLFARRDSDYNWKEFLPGVALGAVAILFLPWLFPEGLPIRGYGLMVLCGAVAALLMAIHRGQQVGLKPDTLLSLAFGMLVCGIVGARLFFVVEYWDTRFRFDTWRKTLVEILKFTEGGLVIYGALFGAMIAFVVFARRQRLPMLALADLIAPSLLVGLALGRIGCLLNGCCYGGPTDLPWGVTFPRDSPAYMDQLEQGQLVGEHPVIDPATGWPKDLPPRSRPVHPTQVYSAVGAGLLCWVLWSYYPWRRRDGEVTLLMFTIEPVMRFLLEVIRVDEASVFGTGLSISQNISIVLLLAAIVGWIWLMRETPRRGKFV